MSIMVLFSLKTGSYIFTPSKDYNKSIACETSWLLIRNDKAQPCINSCKLVVGDRIKLCREVLKILEININTKKTEGLLPKLYVNTMVIIGWKNEFTI